MMKAIKSARNMNVQNADVERVVSEKLLTDNEATDLYEAIIQHDFLCSFDNETIMLVMCQIADNAGISFHDLYTMLVEMKEAIEADNAQILIELKNKYVGAPWPLREGSASVICNELYRLRDDHHIHLEEMRDALTFERLTQNRDTVVRSLERHIKVAVEKEAANA